jgi:sn-glycerol 3-phosphate transport system substrate-binding protein
MVDEHLALNVGRNPSDVDHLIAIGTRDAAMTIGTSAALRSVLTVLESGQFADVAPGVGPMPGPRGGGVLVGGGALWIVARAAPEKQEAARLFARWLDEPEQQVAWHVGTGYIPIRVSATQLPPVQDLWRRQPAFKVAYDQLAQGATSAASVGPVIGAYGEVRDAVVKGLERMWLQGASPEAALRQAEQEANAAIADYNRRVRK